VDLNKEGEGNNEVETWKLERGKEGVEGGCYLMERVLG
jgi:hypothetical protein